MSPQSHTFEDLFVEAVAERVADKIIAKLGDVAGSGVQKRLLSLKEAGEYMGGKTARAIAHMVHDGTIPREAVKRFGERRILIDRMELDKWIAAQ